MTSFRRRITRWLAQPLVSILLSLVFGGIFVWPFVIKGGGEPGASLPLNYRIVFAWLFISWLLAIGLLWGGSRDV